MRRSTRTSLVALLLATPIPGFAEAPRPAPVVAPSPTPAAPAPTTAPSTDFRELFRQAMAAREAGDAATYLARIESAARVHPEPRQLGFRLAGALALNGKSEEAIARLESIAALGIWRDLAAEPDFVPLHRSPRWSELLHRFAALREPLGQGVVAFRLAERDLLVEGIAFDPARRDFLLGSVHQGRIVRRRADGTVSTFAVLAGLAPLGLAVDAARDRLWAVAADLPQLAKREAALQGATFLLAFDLASGREVVRVAPPPGDGQALNDLVLAADGLVYVSDGQTGAVWTLAPDARVLEPVLAPGLLRSAGGLALDASGRRLLVADWSRGLARVDLADRSWHWVETPPDLFPVGLDGLVADRGGFVAIQNAFEPARVLRFELTPDGSAVARFAILERAHPEHREPTLGVVVGNDFYYVANSQWEAFGEAGRPISPELLVAPVVLRLPLR